MRRLFIIVNESHRAALGKLLTEYVRGQVHRKVEVERDGRIEDTASTLFLRPLHRYRDTAVEGVHPQDDRVSNADVGGYSIHGFAKRGAIGREDAPVESQHAHLREAHSNIVEVVRSKADFGEGHRGSPVIHNVELVCNSTGSLVSLWSSMP